MKLKNKSIVVTGASSGMGKAIVERFVREGANIIAVARRRERLEELAASLAGLAVGFWKDTDEIIKLQSHNDVFEPAMDEDMRTKLLSGWHKAVGRSLDWAKD